MEQVIGGFRVFAKEYLSQVGYMSDDIQRKIEELNRLRTLATSLSINTSPDRVQTSGSKDKIAGIVAKVVDLENEITSEIDDLCDKRAEIIGKIAKMDNANDKDILIDRFFTRKSLSEIAKERNVTVRRVNYAQKSALKHFEEKYFTQNLV